MNLLVEPTYDKTHKFNTSKAQRTKQTRLFTNTSFFVCFSAYWLAKTLPPSPALSATKFHEKLKQNAIFIKL